MIDSEKSPIHVMRVVIVAYIVLTHCSPHYPASFVGNAVSMHITVTLISVVLWAWVLGSLGGVLAIPLTLPHQTGQAHPRPRSEEALGSRDQEVRHGHPYGVEFESPDGASQAVRTLKDFRPSKAARLLTRPGAGGRS